MMNVYTKYGRTSDSSCLSHCILNPAAEFSLCAALIEGIRTACVGSTGGDGGAGSCFDCARDCMTHVSLCASFND